ncbi:hypothetical protein DFH06DRAFT_416793 [Mycena polygramma]|nr:hypothetical protein DFH06DRAFT_416793 [Mycena polygramma]
MNSSTRALPESSSSTISGHLSTANSQQRLRATNAYAVSNKEPSSSPTSPVPSHPTNLANILRIFFPFQDIQSPFAFQDHHSPSRSWKALAALVYCFLSFVFTSTALCKFIYLSDVARIYPGNEFVASTAEFVTTEQRFSRISPYLGGSRVLEPYVLAPSFPIEGITACLWTSDPDDAGLGSLVSWASQWAGPISLVMATATHPRSILHRQLLQRLETLRGHSSLAGLSLHLVYGTNGQHSPSAYLNLARLFASTRTVMLFPANLSNNLPTNFYNNLTSRIPHSAKTPLLITGTATSAFSIPALTPIILPQNYPSWCTERAFRASRTSDWDDCVWQIWLEEYGLGHANITIAMNPEQLVKVGADLAGLTQRLSGKYRAEMCEVAIRRLGTPDTTRMSKIGKRRLQWVKGFCRQTESFIRNSGL